MALPSKAVAFSAAETTQERERGGVFGSILQETLFHDDDAELGADGARPGAGELFYCEQCPMRLEHFRTSLPTCSPVREAVHGRDFRSVLKYYHARRCTRKTQAKMSRPIEPFAHRSLQE